MQAAQPEPEPEPEPEPNAEEGEPPEAAVLAAEDEFLSGELAMGGRIVLQGHMTKLKKKKLSRAARRYVVLEDRGPVGGAVAVYFDPIDDTNHMAGREQKGELLLTGATVERDGAVIRITAQAGKNAGVPLGFECDTEQEAVDWERELQAPWATPAAVAPAAAATAAVAAAAAPQPQIQTMQIMCPPNAAPGSNVQVMVNGQPLTVQVPATAIPGQPFTFQVPVAAAAAPAAPAVPTVTAAVPTVTAAPQMMQMQVTCPMGAVAGQQIQVQGPTGVLVVQIPAGVMGGMAFTIQAPAAAPGGAQVQQMQMQQQQQQMMMQQQMMQQQQQQQQ